MHAVDVAASELQVIVDRDAVRSGAWRTVHIAVYRSTPTLEDMRANSAAHAALRDRYPDRTAVLTFVERVSRMPDSDVRNHISNAQKEAAPHTRCAATVLGGEGFWVSAAHSVLTGVGLLMRPECPTKIFKNLEEAAPWVVDHLDDPEARPQDLVAAVEALRRGG
jgi:hypothetical protein